MNLSQEKSGGVGDTPPQEVCPSDMGNSADASVGDIAALGFEVLPIQPSNTCGHQDNKIANLYRLPEEMRARRQWCVAGQDDKGTFKAPYICGTTRKASVTDPSQWADFETAIRAAHQAGPSFGVGYVLHKDDPFTIIDLDVKPGITTQEQIDRFWKITQWFDSYTERSQSGNGLHIICRGTMGAGCRRDGVEMYSRERFIVCTGNIVINKPIGGTQEQITYLETALRPQDKTIKLEEVESDLEDSEVEEKLRRAVNGQKFVELCKGDWQGMGYPSQSEADLALMSMFCFHSKSNEQCRRLFRMSALGKRDKATKNDVYLNRTLEVIRGREARENERIENTKELSAGLLMQLQATSNTQPDHLGTPIELPSDVVLAAPIAFSSRIPRDILKRSRPHPFDLNEAPQPIAKLAHAFSSATGFDHSGMIVAATTAAASIIDDRYRLSVNPGSDWTVSARQWAFLCAPPSGGKSPIIRPATDPIKRLHAQLFNQWKEENDHLKDEREKAPMPALYTSDATVPALTERLKDNPQGILMLNEEFASWIGAIDSADKGEAAKNRGDWLQLRDGGPRQIDRISRGSVHVPNWGASVLAACTPDGIARQMKNMPEDGLIQRFVPCIMGTPNLEADGDCKAEIETWEKVLHWGYKFTNQSHQVIRFSQEARRLFEYEHGDLRKLLMAVESYAPAYAAHLGKHSGMLAEVALTFHVFSGRQPGPEIDSETMNTAIMYMRRVRKHAYHLYSAILNTTPAFDLAQALARSIVASDPPITTVSRDWMTQHCQGFKKAEERLRREAVQFLEDADWLEADTSSRTYGGWPSKYAVHGKVFQLFAREGEQWRARRAAVREAIGEGP